MPTEQDLTAEVQRLFRETLNVEVPSLDTDVIETGLLDSLALVELLAAIEEQFQIQLPLDGLEVESFRTVETIAAFIAQSNGANKTSSD
jgi:acyl carrier protein